MITSGNLIVTLTVLVNLLLSHCYFAASSRTVLLEAEKGNTTGERKYRDSASNGESIYLTDGEYTSISFSTNTECTTVVLNVRYSEGSAVDTATVSIDGQVIGSFRTTASSHSTDPWNDFYDSGQVGGETTLAAGEHTVKIAVSTTDEYGMEVDYIQLRTICENITRVNEDLSPPTGTEEQSKGTEHNSLSVGGIIGIVLTALAVIIVTVIVVLSLLVYRRRKNKETYEPVPNTRRDKETYEPVRVPNTRRDKETYEPVPNTRRDKETYEPKIPNRKD